MTAPRAWLIGESNPYQSGEDHGFDLYPLPPHSAGGRLCSKILGLTVEEYLERFERRNLLNGVSRWSVPAARVAADKLLAEHPDGDALVLLGARVTAAFGRAFDGLFEPCVAWVGTSAPRERRVLVLPHPSGLSRAWHDPTAIPRTRAAVERLLVEMGRGRRIEA